MKKHLFTTILVSALTLPVCAQGIYVVADFERNKIEVDAVDASLDESDNGYGIGLGYTYKFKSDISALQASLLASYPLNDAVSIYGRLGVGRIEVDSEIYANDWGDITRDSESVSKTKALFGIGGRYAITEQL